MRSRRSLPVLLAVLLSLFAEPLPAQGAERQTGDLTPAAVVEAALRAQVDG